MKVKLNYKGKEVVAEIADEELEKLVAEPKKKTGWEKVSIGEIQYRINSYGGVDAETRKDSFNVYSYCMDEIGNSFSIEELAENILRARTLHENMLRRSVELCGKFDYCSDKGYRYFIEYSYYNNQLLINSCVSTYRHFYEIYFDSLQHAQQVMEEFRDELIWYFTEFKERMD